MKQLPIVDCGLRIADLHETFHLAKSKIYFSGVELNVFQSSTRNLKIRNNYGSYCRR
jgi:hypothetical protein